LVNISSCSYFFGFEKGFGSVSVEVRVFDFFWTLARVRKMLPGRGMMMGFLSLFPKRGESLDVTSAYFFWDWPVA